MSWMNLYQPPSATMWQGRPDTPPNTSFFQMMQLLNLTQAPLPEHQSNDEKAPIAFGILGFCCDEGVRRNYGRTGAKEGPAAIRDVLAKMPINKKNIICYDVGDILCKNEDLESAQTALSDAVCLLLKQGIVPIILGGGHEMAWGHYQGLQKYYPNDEISIINFDAHLDMRDMPADGKGTSGTPFLQMAQSNLAKDKSFDYNIIGIQQAGNAGQLFKTAEQYDAQILFAEDLHLGRQNESENFINRIIFYKKFIYLTLCMDVFAAPFAPGVSAPQAMGIYPWHILPLVQQLAASGKVISYDIAELLPEKDIDQRTAKLAANFIYAIVHYHTLIR